MFNDPTFIQEFLSIIKPLNVKTALEVGCLSGELKDALESIGIKCDGIDLNATRPDVIAGDFFTHPLDHYDLVFSSGLLEHYSRQDALKMVKRMRKLGTHVLNLVPNSECEVYMKARSETSEPWGKEEPFTLAQLIVMHKDAKLEVVNYGLAGFEWSKRFGGDGSQSYLVYCLGRKA